MERIYEETELFGFKVETDSTFQCAPHKHMTDADLMTVWECCNRYRQPVFLHLFTDRDVEDLETLTRRFSHITYVICHMGADSCFLPGETAEFQRY